MSDYVFDVAMFAFCGFMCALALAGELVGIPLALVAAHSWSRAVRLRRKL